MREKFLRLAATPSCRGRWSGQANGKCLACKLKARAKTTELKAARAMSATTFPARYSTTSRRLIYRMNFSSWAAKRCLHQKGGGAAPKKLPIFCRQKYSAWHFWGKILTRPSILIRKG